MAYGNLLRVVGRSCGSLNGFLTDLEQFGKNMNMSEKTMVYGSWTMHHGLWTMDFRKWTMDRAMDYGPAPSGFGVA